MQNYTVNAPEYSLAGALPALKADIAYDILLKHLPLYGGVL